MALMNASMFQPLLSVRLKGVEGSNSSSPCFNDHCCHLSQPFASNNTQRFTKVLLSYRSLISSKFSTISDLITLCRHCNAKRY